ncbi:conserved exported hypothetical protein [Candidatus Sulfotelmatobacter kueseliae]|uniref:TonB-dependent transporter Oar-like beta-barrel domain-containing protein n=1 Tax=Candidatus Sulfotelmatobacter kueseliae TaxID=2042962 RepID=A0A2U3KM03_9BACT|nr:conserved exported hypothetical protein [Candidatus Sulfotelmatobacter kueseliae]
MPTPTGKQLNKVINGVLVAFLLTLPLPSLFAQNRNTGEIRGTITDSSGARVAEVHVVVTSTQTGIATKVVADATGTYDVLLLPPGEYTVEFSKEGYKKFVRQGITLHVEIVTLDAMLVVGATNETVTVTADVPLVQTETSDRSVVFSGETINDLPNIGRAWWDITGQLPGVNPGGNSTGAGQDASGAGFGVNGNPGYMENFLTDGGVTTLPVSQNPGNMVPLDDISEVDMSTSNFGAEYGGGVAALNVITKSGGNKFHGSLYDFEQNNALGEARNYFASSPLPLRWHMFGGTIGGPIRHNKAFFFFSLQDNPTITYSPGFYTFPTPAMQQGDFSAFEGAQETDTNGNLIYNPCNNYGPLFAGQIYQFNTVQTLTYQQPGGGPSDYNGQEVTCRTPYAGNKITDTLNPLALKLQAFFPSVPDSAGIPSNNYYFNAVNSNASISYNFKIDYDVSASNRVSGSAMFNPGHSSSPGPACPISAGGGGCSKTTGKGSQAQITDVWTMSSKLVNEARVSFVRQYGLWYSPDVGAGFPAKLGIPLFDGQSDVFPNISIDGTAGTSLGTSLSAKLGFDFYMASDTVTWSRGKHILKFGGEFDRWQDTQSWANLDAGNYDFSGNYTTNPMDPSPQSVGYADFLLGLTDNWGVTVTPEVGGRAWNLQGFANDDYKITPHLTLNLGVRYLLQTGWSEVKNQWANFTPNLYNSGINPTDPSGASNFPPGYGANCYGGVNFNGYHCPTAQIATVKDIFQPRFGFAWSPKEKWSVRGGYGMFSEMWGGNNYFNTFPAGFQINGSIITDNNILNLPTFPLNNGPTFTLASPSIPQGAILYPGPAARQPWSLNGQGTSWMQYHAKAAYVQQFSLDIQHQIGRVGLDAAYVGSKGEHLLFSRQIDETPAAFLGQGLAGLPYPQYPGGGIPANIYDGISNYNSLQLSARTMVSHGLSFRVNYTFSKALDEFTSPGSCCTSDSGAWQNAYNPRSMYAVASYDVPQLWSGSAVYDLPFGTGKQLLNRSGLLNTLVGGWQVSSVFQVHSGLPFTPLMAYNLSGAINGSSWWPNRVCNGTLSHPVVTTNSPTATGWFDTTCFQAPAEYTYGDSRRDVIRGPDWRTVNMSLAKHFALKKLGEGGQLEMRVDVYDIANHPNFGQPNASIGSGSEGSITSANTNRNLQVGAKLSF